jgi:hypothetical protein
MRPKSEEMMWSKDEIAGAIAFKKKVFATNCTNGHK